MRQIIKKIGAALCAGAILLSVAACGMVEVDAAKDNARIAAKVDDIEITKGEWREMYESYAAQYGITDEIANDPQYKEAVTEFKNQLLDALVMDKIGLQEMKASGMTLTDEEKAEIQENAEGYIEQQRSFARMEWEEKAKTDKTIDVEKEVENAVNEWLSINNLSQETIMERYSEDKLMQKFMAQLLDDVTATNDEVKAQYDAYVESQKTEFATEGALDYAEYQGTVITYRPAGYVRVKHILIRLDETTRNQVSTLRTEKNDTQADQVRTEGLKQIQAKADEVLSKVKAGEDFDALIEQYNDDPGMQNSPTKETGYTLGKSSFYRQEFIDASLALPTVGDASELVVTDEGYHIIKLLEKLPEGPVDYEKVRETIEKEVVDGKKGVRWSELLEEWKPKHKIEYHYNIL